MPESVKKIFVAIVGILAAVYLLNFTFGVFELPDNIPIVGNIDETVAAGFLFAALRYFGFDVTNIFKKKETKDSENPKTPLNP